MPTCTSGLPSGGHGPVSKTGDAQEGSELKQYIQDFNLTLERVVSQLTGSGDGRDISTTVDAMSSRPC